MAEKDPLKNMGHRIEDQLVAAPLRAASWLGKKVLGLGLKKAGFENAARTVAGSGKLENGLNKNQRDLRDLISEQSTVGNMKRRDFLHAVDFANDPNFTDTENQQRIQVLVSLWSNLTITEIKAIFPNDTLFKEYQNSVFVDSRGRDINLRAKAEPKK